jgi:2-keto-3-deoxy-6-phosphogluconate aldolase
MPDALKQLLIKQGFLPILINDSYDAVFLAECCLNASAKAIEITCRRNNVVNEIKNIKRLFPELHILVGSVVDNGPLMKKLQEKRPDFPSIEQLIDIGIDGFVSAMPLKIKTIQKYSRTHLIAPGVLTPKDAVETLEAGACFAKFFDLQFRGEENYLTLLNSAPFYGLLDIFVTGGITLNKIKPYKKAGAKLLGSGFDIILKDKGDLNNNQKNFELISSCINLFLKEAAVPENHIPL